ncbi:beta-ketoacyl-ACP synthase III [Streptomyces sp. NPDC014894]|uniref:beta-ketoacyl-ACP synthase III n=1 Tax=Streptomyces sp. NPDC014894 TaxID=3364931 RepID=UPI0036FA652B
MTSVHPTAPRPSDGPGPSGPPAPAGRPGPAERPAPSDGPGPDAGPRPANGAYRTAEARTAVLAGIGYWLPPTVLTNDDLGPRVGTSAEWLRSRTGITSRHVAGPGTATADLAVEAGRRAMASAGIDRVDLVLVATTSPDRVCPATAPDVAARLGQPQIAALDVGAACSGFLYGLAVAGGMIASGAAGRVLVIGAETLTSLLDPGDRATSAIFADGAGAVVLRAGRPGEPGSIGPVVLGSDGAASDLIEVPAGGSRDPGPGTPDSPGARYLSVSGPEVFRLAVKRMTEVSHRALAEAGWRLPEVDRVVAHQANAHILAAVGRKLGVRPDRMATNIQHVGNTSAASIPILLAQDADDGRVKPGDRVLLTAFGGGLTWAATTLVWPTSTSTSTRPPPPTADAYRAGTSGGDAEGHVPDGRGPNAHGANGHGRNGPGADAHRSDAHHTDAHHTDVHRTDAHRPDAHRTDTHRTDAHRTSG